MKKLLTAILLVACIATMLFALTACSPAGEYKFYSLEEDGKVYKIGDEYEGIEITEEMAARFGTVKLEKDGTAVISGVEGTWKKEGSKIVITMTVMGMSTTQEIEYKGGKLIAEQDGVKITYSK